MKIDLYCQQKNCNPLNYVDIDIDYVDIPGRSSTGVYNQNTVGKNVDFQAM